MKTKVRIGYWDRTCRTPLYFPGDSHLTLCAPSGAGKGRDILIPASLEFPGSLLPIDPKGQNAAVTHRARAKIGPVYQLNPFGILPANLAAVPHAGVNPLSVLNAKTKGFGADCDGIGEAIVLHESGSEGAYFSDAARMVASGVIMGLVKYAPPSKRNLVEMYRIITGPDFFNFVAWVMRQAKQCGDILLPGRLGGMAMPKASESREMLGILNTARVQCSFIGNEAISESLNPRGHEIRFSTLRQTPTTVFLILPTEYLSSCGKWFRIIVQTAMMDMLRERGAGQTRVLALLDECAQLGPLSILSDMMGIGRGYNVQLWTVWQDLNQIRKLYPQDFETFLGNAGAQLFMAPRDNFSARWVAEKCGVTEVSVKRPHFSPVALWEPRGTQETPVSVSVGVEQIARPMMHPHEVAYLGGDEMIVFGENLGGIIRAGRKSYLKTREYAGKYDPDPYHAGEKRSWWSW